MSRDMFDEITSQSERKLVVIDNLVLDVTQFAENHPGGKFVIDKLNGRDISKFFYGGYSFEQNSGSQNHTHSNYARRIVNDLIVARIGGPR